MAFHGLTAFFDRFGHRRYRALLSPYIDGELSAEMKRQVEAHLERCAGCRAELDELLFASRLASRLSILNENPSSFPRWQQVEEAGRFAPQSANGRRRLAVITATAAVVMLAVAAGWFFTRETGDTWQVMRTAGAPAIGKTQVKEIAQFKAGQWLETDPESRALIKVGTIGVVEVSPNTRIGLVTARPDNHRLSLTKGRIEAAIAAPPRLFFIETLAATAIDYGCAYSLEVNEDSECVLRVTAGWVALNLGERESLVPAGALCHAIPGKGPGTPYLEDSSAAFRSALRLIDFGESGGRQVSGRQVNGIQVNILLAEARAKDALSLWHLLARLNGEARGRVYDRLAALVPPPHTVTREAVLRLDRQALDAWKESVELASVGVTLPAIPMTTGALQPVAGLNQARYAHAAALLADGRVLVMGGVGPEFVSLASTEVFDPATNRFTASAPMLAQRASHAATRLNNGQVLITGGFQDVRPRVTLSTAELFDPATGSFRQTGRMTAPRESHKATLLPDGKVLITGGHDRTGRHLASAEIYDPATRQFTSAGSMLTPRSDHVATLLSNGMVLVTGGMTNAPAETLTLSSAELFDPLKRVFSAVGSMHTVRAKHSAALLPDGKVIVMGGTDVRLGRGKKASAELYDPAKRQFAQTGNMNTARYKIRDAVVVLRDGRVLVAGGGTQVEVYDPASGVFRLVKGDLGAARHYATATLLADGRVLFAGGYATGSNAGLIAEAGAWIYQP
ncbi:MAG TPA: zf-HC2 domain-containing protein [Blastocatellia bacterium]